MDKDYSYGIYSSEQIKNMLFPPENTRYFCDLMSENGQRRIEVSGSVFYDSDSVNSYYANITTHDSFLKEADRAKLFYGVQTTTITDNSIQFNTVNLWESLFNSCNVWDSYGLTCSELDSGVLVLSTAFESWVDFQIGDFYITQKSVSYDGNVSTYSAQLMSPLIIPQLDCIDAPLFAPASSNVFDIVYQLLTKYTDLSISIQSNSTLNTGVDLNFEVGARVVEIINELLDLIGFTWLRCDHNGTIYSAADINPESVESDIIYDAAKYKVLLDSYITTDDTFNIPNIIIAVNSSSVNSAPLIGKYINSSPASKTSTINTGVNVVAPVIKVDGTFTQDSINEYAAKEYFKQSNIKNYAEFYTAVNPFQRIGDIIEIRNCGDLSGLYLSKSFEIPLSPGQPMKQKAVKIYG